MGDGWKWCVGIGGVQARFSYTSACFTSILWLEDIPLLPTTSNTNTYTYTVRTSDVKATLDLK